MKKSANYDSKDLGIHKDELFVKIGKWFTGAARGRYTVTLLIILAAAIVFIFGKGLGF